MASRPLLTRSVAPKRSLSRLLQHGSAVSMAVRYGDRRAAPRDRAVMTCTSLKTVSGKTSTSPATPLTVKTSISGAAPERHRQIPGKRKQRHCQRIFVIFSLFFCDFFTFALFPSVVHCLRYWINKHVFVTRW